MTFPTRDELDRLIQRLGPLGEEHPARLDPARRAVRHMVAGIDAYLIAEAAGAPSTATMRPQALELWESLQDAAVHWSAPPAATEVAA